MRDLYIVFLVISVLLLNQSCDQGNVCQDALEFSANAGFYRNVYNVIDDTTFENVAFKGIQIPDTIPFDTLQNRKYLLLPLPQGSDSCRFVLSFAVYDSIDINDTVRDVGISHFVDDTLQINFSRQMYLVSPDCGFSHLYELKSVSYSMNFIKSAEIVNSEISGYNEENIRIYF